MLGGMYLQGDRSGMCVVGIQFPSPTPPLGMFRFHYDESLDMEFVSRHRRRYRLQGPTYWIKTVPYNNNLVPVDADIRVRSFSIYSIQGIGR